MPRILGCKTSSNLPLTGLKRAAHVLPFLFLLSPELQPLSATPGERYKLVFREGGVSCYVQFEPANQTITTSSETVGSGIGMAYVNIQGLLVLLFSNW